MVTRDPLQQKRYKERVMIETKPKPKEKKDLSKILEVQFENLEDLIEVLKNYGSNVVFYKEPIATEASKGSLQFHAVLETEQGNFVQYSCTKKLKEEKKEEGVGMISYEYLEWLKETYKDFKFLQATIKFSR